MRYWFFDGNDVTGPFTIKELQANKAFCQTSLICPENFSDDEDHWQVAGTFDAFALFFRANAPEEEDDTVTLEQELDTLLNEKSPLGFERVPTDGPGLQIPQKPAKPGPIEDYFNNIKKEDLGDILGIPDPNDNSDMDLAHALEKQLAKTSSTRRERQEQPSAADMQTAQELTRTQTAQELAPTHRVATATEVFATRAPAPATLPQLPALQPASDGMPVVESPHMPTLSAEPPQPLEQPAAPLEQPAAQTEADEPEELVPQAAALTAPAGTQQPVQEEPHPAQKSVQEKQQQPVQEKQPDVSHSFAPDPALLRREKVEVNSIRPKLNQTEQMKDFLHHTQQNHLKKQTLAHRRAWIILLAFFIITGGVAAVLWLRMHTVPAAPTVQPVKQTARVAQELLDEKPPVAVVPPVPEEATPAADTSTQAKQALSIVQNHRLSGQRGSIKDYLNRIYKSQLSQGYTAQWGAEPLYKNTYVVKYQLTKPRKEPIIYVFQADVAKGKLTGALNNISIDLVGKI